MKRKILFVCIHNSARSQMAEAFLNEFAGDDYEAESAGIEAGTLNPIVVKAMQEVGIDISHKTTQEVFDLLKKGNVYQAVVTVCDAASAESCPVFPGMVRRFAWSFEDPSTFTGTADEKLSRIRLVRDKIKQQVLKFIEDSKHDIWVHEEH